MARWTWLSVLIVLLCMGQVGAEPDLSADARLQKPLRVQMPNALLSEILEEVGKQTGVPFSCDSALDEEKATLFITDKPAWQVLSKLSALLGLQWEAVDTGYRLRPDLEARRQEESTLAWERHALRRDAEKTLREWAQATREDYHVILQRKRALEQEAQRLEQEKPPGWQERRDAISKQLHPLTQITPSTYLAGWLYRRFPQSVWRRMWDGEIVWFSTVPAPGATLLPEDTPIINAVPFDGFSVFRFGIRWQEGRFRFFIWVPAPLPDETTMSVTEEEIRSDVSLPANAPLHLRWQRWQTPVETLERDPRLQRRIKPQDVQTSAGGEITCADLLQRLATLAGFNVVADAFRFPAFSTQESGTLFEWLYYSELYQFGYLRLEADWALFRHWPYWHLRRTEFPEKLVRQLERKAQEEGFSLEDYATLAVSMPKPRSLLHEYALRIDLTPLEAGAPALRFWASLSDAQRRTALQGQPLAYPQLTPAQQRLFRDALLAKLIEEPNRLLFDLLHSPEQQIALAFVVERWGQQAYTLPGERVAITAESAQELEQQRRLVPNANEPAKQALVEQYTLYFGLDRAQSAQYRFAVRRQPTNLFGQEQDIKEEGTKILFEK